MNKKQWYENLKEAKEDVYPYSQADISLSKDDLTVLSAGKTLALKFWSSGKDVVITIRLEE